VPTEDLLGSLVDRARIGVALIDADGRFHYVNERMAEMNGAPAARHLGRTVADVLPELADELMPLIRQALVADEPLVAVEVDGTTPAAEETRHWHASYVPVHLSDGPGVGVVVIEVTERERAITETRRRLGQQAALADLGQFALRHTELDAVLTEATTMLGRELRSERAGVLTFTPGRDRLVMQAGVGFPDGAIGRMTAEVGPRSQAGYTLSSDGPVISRDTLAEDRFPFTPALLALGVRSAISVPIPGEREPFGVLGVLASRPDHFDADDANLVRATANVLGAAAVRAAQAEQLAELAEQRGRLVAQALDAGDRERRQVADTLHDEVLQHLLFARLELSSGGSDRDGESTLRVRSSMEEAVRVLRGVIGGLHPVTLAHAGLGAAIDSLAAEHRQRTGLRTDVEVDPAAHGRQDRLVLSLARELLTNVVKHADAGRAAVTVGLDADGALRLEVADDGCGLAPDAFESALARGNVGLANVRERVAALRGSIDVSRGLGGRGARIAIRLPSG
jgi:PAS domain S-box-containing protein